MNQDAFLRSRSRGNDETVARYKKSIHQFQGWLGTRQLTPEAVTEYEFWLKRKYRTNSLSVIAPAINFYLEWKGVPYRIRKPPKEYVANPRLIRQTEYEELIARIADSEERLIVRLLHDTGLRPSDVVAIRVGDLADVEGTTAIRRRTQKTGRVSESYLTPETTKELRDYILANGITDLLFTVDKERPRHRTWPNTVLRRHHADGITPKTFRRTLATNWDDDLAGLMAQGGWTDPKTVLRHYRRDVHERHLRGFRKAMNISQSQKPPPNPLMENDGDQPYLPPTRPNDRSPRSPEVL